MKKTIIRKTVNNAKMIWEKVIQALDEGDLPLVTKLYEEYEEEILSQEEKDVKPRNAFYCWRETDWYDQCIGRGV